MTLTLKAIKSITPRSQSRFSKRATLLSVSIVVVSFFDNSRTFYKHQLESILANSPN